MSMISYRYRICGVCSINWVLTQDDAGKNSFTKLVAACDTCKAAANSCSYKTQVENVTFKPRNNLNDKRKEVGNGETYEAGSIIPTERHAKNNNNLQESVHCLIDDELNATTRIAVPNIASFDKVTDNYDKNEFSQSVEMCDDNISTEKCNDNSIRLSIISMENCEKEKQNMSPIATQHEMKRICVIEDESECFRQELNANVNNDTDLKVTKQNIISPKFVLEQKIIVSKTVSEKSIVIPKPDFPLSSHTGPFLQTVNSSLKVDSQRVVTGHQTIKHQKIFFSSAPVDVVHKYSGLDLILRRIDDTCATAQKSCYHQCRICPKIFSRVATLSRHECTHTDTLAYASQLLKRKRVLVTNSGKDVDASDCVESGSDKAASDLIMSENDVEASNSSKLLLCAYCGREYESGTKLNEHDCLSEPCAAKNLKIVSNCEDKLKNTWLNRDEKLFSDKPTVFNEFSTDNLHQYVSQSKIILSETASQQNASTSPSLSHQIIDRSKVVKQCAKISAHQMLICSICYKQSEDNMKLMEHQQLHRPDPSTMCGICQKTFNTELLLEKHYLHKHYDGSRQLFVCSLCPYTIKFVKCFVIHLRLHTREKPYACTYCEKRCISKRMLNGHIKFMHNVESDNENISEQHTAWKFQAEDQQNGSASEANATQQPASASVDVVHKYPRLDLILRRIDDTCATAQKSCYHQCRVCPKIFSRVATLSKHECTHTDTLAYANQWLKRKRVLVINSGRNVDDSDCVESGSDKAASDGIMSGSDEETSNSSKFLLGAYCGREYESGAKLNPHDCLSVQCATKISKIFSSCEDKLKDTWLNRDEKLFSGKPTVFNEFSENNLQQYVSQSKIILSKTVSQENEYELPGIPQKTVSSEAVSQRPIVNTLQRLAPATGSHLALVPYINGHQTIVPPIFKHQVLVHPNKKHQKIAPAIFRHQSIASSTGRHQTVTPATGRYQTISRATGRYQPIASVTNEHQAITPATDRDQTIASSTSRHQTVTPATGRYQTISPATGRHQAIAPATVRYQTIASATNEHQVITPATDRDQAIVPATGRHQAIAPATDRHKTISPAICLIVPQKCLIVPPTIRHNIITASTSTSQEIAVPYANSPLILAPQILTVSEDLNKQSEVSAQDHLTHTCSICLERFDWLVELIEHQKLHKLDPSEICVMCMETFYTKEKLWVHYYCRHYDAYTQLFTCKFCPYTSKHPSNFFNHVKRQCIINGKVPQSPVLCTACGKDCVNDFYLRRDLKCAHHIESYTDYYRPHKCPHCGNRFKELVALKLHVQMYHCTSQAASQNSISVPQYVSQSTTSAPQDILHNTASAPQYVSLHTSSVSITLPQTTAWAPPAVSWHTIYAPQAVSQLTATASQYVLPHITSALSLQTASALQAVLHHTVSPQQYTLLKSSTPAPQLVSLQTASAPQALSQQTASAPQLVSLQTASTPQALSQQTPSVPQVVSLHTASAPKSVSQYTVFASQAGSQQTASVHQDILKQIVSVPQVTLLQTPPAHHAVIQQTFHSKSGVITLQTTPTHIVTPLDTLSVCKFVICQEFLRKSCRAVTLETVPALLTTA